MICITVLTGSGGMCSVLPCTRGGGCGVMAVKGGGGLIAGVAHGFVVLP